MARRRVADALDQARHDTAVWPPLATINDAAPPEFVGLRVAVLDLGAPGAKRELAHVRLIDQPPCTVMNVPPECLDFEVLEMAQRSGEAA